MFVIFKTEGVSVLRFDCVLFVFLPIVFLFLRKHRSASVHILLLIWNWDCVKCLCRLDINTQRKSDGGRKEKWAMSKLIKYFTGTKSHLCIIICAFIWVIIYDQLSYMMRCNQCELLSAYKQIKLCMFILWTKFTFIHLADALAKTTYKRRTKAKEVWACVRFLWKLVSTTEFATFFITIVRSYIAIAGYTLFSLKVVHSILQFWQFFHNS